MLIQSILCIALDQISAERSAKLKCNIKHT